MNDRRGGREGVAAQRKLARPEQRRDPYKLNCANADTGCRSGSARLLWVKGETDERGLSIEAGRRSRNGMQRDDGPGSKMWARRWR